MENNNEIRIEALREQIPVATEFIAGVMEGYGFRMGEILEMQLAVEEACTNIVIHGYHDKGGPIFILSAWDGSRLAVTIVDQGGPFDPTSQGPARPSGDAMSHPIGGLGIHLIRSSVDEMSYRRENGQNALKLVKERRAPGI